ncbi:MAG: glycosyltransferase family 2 protein [Nitrospinae bacterium]|nr:glycosyltransferase family 2 protein [Nitrospinota bacterium]
MPKGVEHPEGAEHIEISVVVPVYNESENLVPLTTRLVEVFVALGKRYEILLVNDGSTDGSSGVLQDLATKHPEVRLIHFRRNAGQTAALDAGFKRARGEVVVTLDADLQNDPHDIPSLLEALNDYDVVCGIRQRRQDSWLRRISSSIANGIRRRVLQDDIIDIGCSLRAYKRYCLAPLKLYHGMHRFLPVLLHLEGFRIGQVPVSHHPRTFGTSKYNVRNRAWRALLDLLAVRWMQRRHLRYEVIEEAREREQAR